MIPSSVRILDRLGNTIAWIVTGGAVLGWVMIQGSSLREAVEVAAGGAVLAAVAVMLGKRVSGDRPLGRVNAAALAGTDLIVSGDRGLRARRLTDGTVVQAPSTVPDSTADRVQLERDVLYGGGAARLWLTGEHRLALHGLQPQPEQAPEFVDGELIVTKRIAARTEGFPVLVLHRRSLARDADHLVTSLALDGTARWTASFPLLGLSRAAFLLADPERVVLVTSSRADGCEAIALDASSGRVTWRSRL